MTQQSFLAEIQAYYKPYNGTQKKYVSQWISTKSEKMLSYVMKETLKTFVPTSTTPTPGISAFEKAEAEVKAHRYQDFLPRSNVLQIEEAEGDPEEIEQKFRELNAKIARMAKRRRVNGY